MAAAHADKVEPIIAPVLARKQLGQRHPTEDFLWNYYSLRPTHLRKWHPGVGIKLEDGHEYLGQRGYKVDPDGFAFVDPDFVRLRTEPFAAISRLLKATQNRKPQFGCYGLHEWAMVYGLEQSEVRHEQAPLRLSPQQIREVVDSSNLICTHIDAFRFFTEAAVPKNRFQPTRETQIDLEQPGCMHANMDLYKWSYKLIPAISSSLLLKTFHLAAEIRVLDMQAAPYDCTEWGLTPLAIETVAGRQEFADRQRIHAEQAAQLRSELIAQLDSALSDS